jgi:hypothetical protein
MKALALWQYRRQFTAFITLGFFSWFSLTPWNYAVADQSTSRFPPPSEQLALTGVEEYARVLLAMIEETSRLSSQASQASDMTTSLANLQAYQQALAQAEAQLLESFKVVESTLTGSDALPSIILQRHHTMIETFKAESQDLHDTLDTVAQLAHERTNQSLISIAYLNPDNL